MEDNLGVKLNSTQVINTSELSNNIVVNQKNAVKKARSALIPGILAIILILTYMFSLKIYEPNDNILVTGGIMVYPLTFLIMAFVVKKYGFKEAKKTVIEASILYVLMFVLFVVCVTPLANSTTTGYNAVLQYVFSNNYIMLGDFTLFYPTLGQFFGVIIAFIISHILFAVIYNAICLFTSDYLAQGLSLFIAYIVDRIVFLPILFLEGLLNGSNTFDYFIKFLTTEFMCAILCTVLILVIYMVATLIKDKVKKA